MTELFSREGWLVRRLDIALATLAMRVLPARAPQPERRLALAIDEAEAALLSRNAMGELRAALVDSLWPAPARQCVAPALYVDAAAPAQFGRSWVISWPRALPREARELRDRLALAFAVDHGAAPELPTAPAIRAA